MGSGCVTPPFLTSVLYGGEWSALSSGCFISGERAPQYLLERRPGGPQSWSGYCGEEKCLASASHAGSVKYMRREVFVETLIHNQCRVEILLDQLCINSKYLY
jgi:hypothetical protein